MPEQIDLAKVRAAGVRDLKHYLEFALKGPRALVEQSSPTGLEPDSPFETAVIKVLRDRGWSVHPQVGCSGYRIDIGVVDPRAPGRYLVGIECDGASYHSGATARDRDRLRQHVLEGLGWRIHRIWSTNWWMNPEGEIEAVAGLLQELLVEAEPAEDAAPPADDADISEPAEGDYSRPAPAIEPNATSETADATPDTAHRERPMRVFEPARLPSGDPVEFYEDSSSWRLSEHLRLAVDAEGPILDAVLFRRVARAWGLERTGSRIVERLTQRVTADIPRTVEGGSTFYWPTATVPTAWADCRVADANESSRRHVDEVCVEEISALVMHVLNHAGASPRTDAARAVCRMLGMARTPADAEARVGQAINRLIECGLVTELDGTVRVPS
jgi:very-short-patch-repair endonuclease